MRKVNQRSFPKTSSEAPYHLLIAGHHIHNAPDLNDLPYRLAMDPAIIPTLLVWVWSNATFTMAQVRSHGDHMDRTGIGVTKRCPKDPPHLLGATRLAVRRALVDWRERASRRVETSRALEGRGTLYAAQYHLDPLPLKESEAPDVE